MKNIIKAIYMIFFGAIWRKDNKSNETFAVSTFNRKAIYVGRNTYGPLRIQHYNRDAKLTIGSYCSIADNVTFLLGGEHDYKKITSFPFNSKVYHVTGYSAAKNRGGGHDIIIGDDVWIGYGATILSGVTIGTGAIIGAGAIVAKDIPPYSVYVGNKVIKQRFSDEIVERLMKINWNKISHQKGDSYEKYVNTPISETNIDEILNSFLE